MASQVKMSETKIESTASDLGWKALEESLAKLSVADWRSAYYDSDDDREEEEEREEKNECRPENAEIALKLLPMLKDKCGDRVPFASTSRGGTVTLTWTNRQTHSRVTCSIQVDEKGYEVDVSKYPTHGDPAFWYFSLSTIAENREESIGKALVGFLSDISL